jgi:rare lipoprotein A
MIFLMVPSGTHGSVAAKKIIAPPVRHQVCVGWASWYGRGFFNHRLSSHGRYRADAIFVAHRSYPFGTKLRITNLENNKTLIAAVEDRGPFVPGRSIDLSQRAAELLDTTKRGVVRVSYEVVQ